VDEGDEWEEAVLVVKDRLRSGLLLMEDRPDLPRRRKSYFFFAGASVKVMSLPT
jgi:hypothetical protein